MWPEWLRSPSSSPSRVHPRSKSFSCSSFKDIQAILKEPGPEPRSSKSPSVFHRVRISTSVLRSWAHKNSIPSSHSYAHPSFGPPHQGIILFFTSLRVVRKTYEDCRTVRSILRGFRVPIDERDLSMDSKFLDELQGIIGCNGKNLTLPKVFIGGRYIGGAEEIKRLNESGDLKHLISKLQLVGPTFCDRCGGMRFVLCEECNGSHKIYMEKCGFRTCNSCNINGLIMCPSCCFVGR